MAPLVGDLDPNIATALAPLIAALSTAVLMFAAYHWPQGRNEHDDEKDRPKHKKGKHSK